MPRHSNRSGRAPDRGGAAVKITMFWKEVGPEASPGGGEGRRFRAHVVDSESGGAKGHYPKFRTSAAAPGSPATNKFYGRPLIAMLVS